MPLYKRQIFVPKPPPKDLKDDEEVFYLKMTNEIFRDHEEYFDRVIQCNSLVWSCSLTGKINMTFQEAADSEKEAKKQIKGIPKELITPLLYLMTLTRRGKILDSIEEVYTYAKERYFKGEIVHSVIGTLWCPSRVIRVIYPTQEEIENYKKEQIEKGEASNNDYLDDDSWGPHPDIFRYEVAETEPDDPNTTATFILEAIDVKRVKSNFSKDKCRCLLKLLTYFDETTGIWKLKKEVITSTEIDKKTFEDYFTGNPPFYEPTPLPVVVRKSKMNTSQSQKGSPTASAKKENMDNSQSQSSSKKSKSKEGKDEIGKGKAKDKEKEKGSKKSKSLTAAEDKDKGKPSKKNNSKKKSMENSDKSGSKLKNTKITDFLQKVPKGSQKDFPKNQEPKKKKEKVLTPEELKKIELAKKARERERKKEEKKLIADFKKAWYKPKEDLEVEDLKDLPSPDPIICKIPNHLFGDFVMVLEYFSCYSSVLKVRDSFPYGLTFDVLLNALIKNEIAGAFSDILQMLIRAIFRLQEQENAEINAEAAAAEQEQQDQDEKGQDDFSVDAAIQQATQASTWSILYQNTPMHKLAIDHFSISEILRLHLLSSGANPSDKNGKYRWQTRGNYESRDDPGLYLRMEEPQIIKTLAQGTVFDLSITERLKVLNCLLNQIMTYVSVRDIIEESFEQFKQNRIQLRALQAKEKKNDIEDQLWRNRLRYDRQIPDKNALKSAVAAIPDAVPDEANGGPPNITTNGEGSEVDVKKNTKPLLTDEEIEAAIVKKDKEIARRKQDFEYKQSDLLHLINKIERKLNICPIGRDRAFRRFWIFESIPGIFVEHDDEYVGTCPPQPTPFLTNINLDDPKFIQDNLNKVKSTRDKEGSDKENSPKKLSKKKSKDCLGQNDSNINELPQTPKIFGVCSGDSQSCPVHCTYLPKHKWGFFWNKEQIDELIEGLSPRGIREKELKETLMNEKDFLIKQISKCPYEKLNIEKEFPVIIDEKANKRPARGAGGSTLPKNHLDPNLNFPSGTTLDTILELQLRDLILETEEKIFLGALGSLKVKDRNSWRTALEGRSYDKQNEIKWGYSSSKKKSSNGGNTSSEITGSDNNLAADKIKSNPNSGRNTPEPFQQPSKKDSLSKFKEREESRPTSSKSSVSSSCSNENLKDIELFALNPVVKDLACAILQIGQCIESKFLKKPLGIEKEDDKKKKSKGGSTDVENVMKGKTLEGTAVERWETSLMSCTNFSQLFLHLFTLDNSIEWTRSVLNARCRVCRRKGDSENMLLCDGCNKGHHSYCLKPPLTVIPKEDWFCVDCKPVEEMPKLSRARKSFNEEDDYSLMDSSDEEHALGAKSLDDSIDESCTVCGAGGELLMCDGCDSGTHMFCLDPPKSRIPRGDWFCSDCTNGSKKRKPPTKRDDGGRGKKRKGKQQTGGRRKASRRDDSTDEEDESEEEEEIEESSVNESENDENVESGENDDASEDDESQDRSNGVIETDEDEDNENGDDEEYNTPVTKIKFSNKKKASTSPSFGRAGRAIIESDEESDDDPRKSRNKRAKASHSRIHKRSKVDNDTSDNSSSDSNFGKRKRSSAYNREVQHSKRTRMNNNIDDGQLNNVVLSELINDLLKHDEAWPFVKPVNKREVPDYLEKIKHPMDLGTIKHKLNIMNYTMNEEFFSDLQLVFANCMEYNEPSSDVYRSGVKLKTYCEKRVKRLGFQWGGEDID